VVHGPQAHFLPDLLPEADHGDAEDCGNLVDGVLLLLFVVRADVKHALNLEDVAGTRVGAGLDDEGQEGAELGVLDDGGGRNGRICQILLAQEEQAET
jgi:hypothetical protein